MQAKDKTISRIREFNRFYMPKLELLDHHYLGSSYNPTEARVLYEILENDGCSAAYITKNMNIDKSYLSRIIRGYEKKGFLIRTISSADSRVYHLHLTAKGLKETQKFVQKSNQQIDSIIKHLQEEDYIRLMNAFDTITTILGECDDPDSHSTGEIICE